MSVAAATIPDRTFLGFAAQFGTAAHDSPDGSLGYYAAALTQAISADFDRLEDLHLDVSKIVLFTSRLRQAPVYHQGRQTIDAPWLAGTGHYVTRPFSLFKVADDCAQSADVRVILSGTTTVWTGAGVRFRQGPNYSDDELTDIERICQAAFDDGARDRSVLRGIALTAMKRLTHDRRCDDVCQGNLQLRNIAFLAQAAESGDDLANYALAVAGGRGLLGITLDKVKDRLLQATASPDPVMNELVSGVFLSRTVSDFRTQTMVIPDDMTGSRLFRNAALNGDPTAAVTVFVFAELGKQILQDVSVLEVVNRARKSSTDFGFYIDGTTVHETLDLLALRYASETGDWAQFASVTLDIAPSLDRLVNAYNSSADKHLPSAGQLLATAACIAMTGRSPSGEQLSPKVVNREAAQLLARYAEADGQTIGNCAAR